MSALGDVAAEILDRLVDVVSGPVSGTITTTCTSGRVCVPRGQIATLPDGRRVRVTHNKWVEGTDVVRVRLEHLTPSSPRANNFAVVQAGAIATWVSPPPNIAPTGTVTANFAPGSRAGAMKVGALAESDSPDAFPAGAQGTAALILISPSLRNIGSPNTTTRGTYEATWRLRLNLYDNAEQGGRRIRARDAFDAIVESLQGATAGDDPVRIGAWTQIREGLIWEATLLTRVMIEGRVLHDAELMDPLEGIDIAVLLPGDDAQPDPFRVLESIDV